MIVILVLRFGLLYCTFEVTNDVVGTVDVSHLIDGRSQEADDVVFRLAFLFKVVYDLFSPVVVHNSNDCRLELWTGQAGSLTINPPRPGFKGPEGSVNLI